MSSGLTITADPALTGPVTIINPKQVTLDEAFVVALSITTGRPLLVAGPDLLARLRTGPAVRYGLELRDADTL